MKFFDYKFLILLGLTLVVYFIYREVEYLRSKIDKLEGEFKKNNSICLEETNILEDKTTNDSNKVELPVATNKKPVLELPKPPMQKVEDKNEPSPKVITDLTVPPKSPPKIISIGLESTSIVQTTVTNNNTNKDLQPGIKVNPFQLINEITNQTENDSDNDESESSESSKHLAIYSNDNEQEDETQNSLLESVEANKKEMTFQYDNQMANITKTVDDIINSMTTDDEEIKIGKSEEKNKVSPDKTQSDKESEGYNEEKLNDMKLPDIKKIAEKMKITITKKVNGQQKPKNKQELINEIIKK
jgi:hypothetical protein